MPELLLMTAILVVMAIAVVVVIFMTLKLNHEVRILAEDLEVDRRNLAILHREVGRRLKAPAEQSNSARSSRAASGAERAAEGYRAPHVEEGVPRRTDDDRRPTRAERRANVVVPRGAETAPRSSRSEAGSAARSRVAYDQARGERSRAPRSAAAASSASASAASVGAPFVPRTRAPRNVSRETFRESDPRNFSATRGAESRAEARCSSRSDEDRAYRGRHARPAS